MRARFLLALVAVFLIAFSLRHHFAQLGEVVRTYGTFHGLLRAHPELLYRYPEHTAQTNASTPKIIHQIALGNANLTKYEAAIHSCRYIHPDWQYRLWTDENATAFISEHYPLVLPHYTRYPQNIQRANILRYALLHRFGGVYLDLDITCHVALDSTPLVGLPFVSPGAYPAGVNNAFIAARPGHPFLAELLDSVPRHDLYWGLPMRIPYVENMLSTGCMFFTNRWMDYVRDVVAGGHNETVHILADGSGSMEPHMLRGKITTPIFSHGGASSWHSWDAALILAIGEHYLFSLALLLAASTLAFGSVFIWWRRPARCHRKGWFFSRMARNSWRSTGLMSTQAKAGDSFAGTWV